MARPIKKGLDYFSVDVGIYGDNKIGIISAKYGLEGEGVIFRLMRELYCNDGYYLEWDETAATLFGRQLGLAYENTLARDVVNDLVENGFFNKGVYEEYSVLTSVNIQKRYLEAVSRRKEVNLIEEYWLAEIPKSYPESVNVNINSINADINAVNVCRSTQSKVKKSIKEDDEDIYRRTCETFSRHFGRKPSPAEAAFITRVARNFGFEEFYEYAIETAAAFNPTNPASYIVKIFREWSSAYITTEDELISYLACNDMMRKDVIGSDSWEKLNKSMREEIAARKKKYYEKKGWEIA